MAQIIVVGNISARLVIEVERLPAKGETVQGGPLRSFAGGKGANQAAAAARAGAQVALFGRVGADEFSRLNLKSLLGHGVDISGVARDDSIGTGLAVVAVEASGGFTHITSPGANKSLSAEHIRRADLGYPSLVLGAVEVQADAITEAFKFARESGATTVLSAESAGDVSTELLRFTDYLIANRIQASALSGVDITDEASGSRAVSILKQQVRSAAVITLGEHGVVADHGEGPVKVGSFSVEARDYSVAYDAFVGSFCADLIVEQSVMQALKFASAAGALSLGRTGGQASFPVRREIMEFLGRGPVIGNT